MQAREVLVTGYGLVAPTALDAASLFTTISENRSCIGQHPAFVELGFANPAAGFIDEQQSVSYTHLTLPTSDLV